MSAGKTEQWAKLPYAVHRKGLGPWARLVYAVLLDEARGETTVRMGCRRLANVLHADKDTVGRAIVELEQWKWIEVIRGSNGKSNSYKLLFEEKPTVPRKGTVPATKPSPGRGHRPSPARGHPVPSMGTLPSPGRGHKTRETSSREDRPADKPRKRTLKDDLWDSVCKQFKLKPTTKRQQTRVGKIVSELLELKATVGQLEQAVVRYRRDWPKMECTPDAVLKHWEKFQHDKNATISRPGDAEGNPGGYGGVKRFQARSSQGVLPGCGLPSEVQEPPAEGATEAG